MRAIGRPVAPAAGRPAAGGGPEASPLPRPLRDDDEACGWVVDVVMVVGSMDKPHKAGACEPAGAVRCIDSGPASRASWCFGLGKIGAGSSIDFTGVCRSSFGRRRAYVLSISISYKSPCLAFRSIESQQKTASRHSGRARHISSEGSEEELLCCVSTAPRRQLWLGAAAAPASTTHTRKGNKRGSPCWARPRGRISQARPRLTSMPRPWLVDRSFLFRDR